MIQKREKPGPVTDRADASETTEQDQDEIERRFWQAVDRIRERNADKDPDEELAFITEVVEEVRQEQYDREQKWDRGWQAIDRIRERNADKDPDEVLADVTRIVEEVRQERYERKQREAQARR